MRLFLYLTATLLGLASIPSAYADPVFNDFTIGEPAKPTISGDQLAHGRTVATANANELLHDPDDVVVGNPNGPVTLVQFIDFLCTLSEKMDPAIQALIKANPDLRVVYKPYPLRGDVSFFAAKAALAANKQGKYLPLHIKMMAQIGNLTQEKVLAIAKDLGLDMTKLTADMKNKSFETDIQATHSLASKIGIPGTPVLFFAKTTFTSDENPNLLLYMLGSFNQAELQQAVNKIASEN
jgi:protein-disulfide isomerase